MMWKGGVRSFGAVMHLLILPTETLGTGGTRGGLLAAGSFGTVLYLPTGRNSLVAPKKPKPGGLGGPFRRPLPGMAQAISPSGGGYSGTNVRMRLREAHGQDAGRLGAPSLVAKVARSCKRCPLCKTVSGVRMPQVWVRRVLQTTCHTRRLRVVPPGSPLVWMKAWRKGARRMRLSSVPTVQDGYLTANSMQCKSNVLHRSRPLSRCCTYEPARPLEILAAVVA